MAQALAEMNEQDMAQASARNMAVERRGPWGVQNAGKPWSFICDKREKITEVLVAHGDNITGIGMVTVKPTSDGKWTAASHMFGNFQENLSKVALRQGEYVTRISGVVATYVDNMRVITKLNIHTNLVPGGYGLYGYGNSCRDFENFSSPIAPNSQVVGFFGTHAHKIRSIGIYTTKVVQE